MTTEAAEDEEAGGGRDSEDGTVRTVKVSYHREMP